MIVTARGKPNAGPKEFADAQIAFAVARSLSENQLFNNLTAEGGYIPSPAPNNNLT